MGDRGALSTVNVGMPQLIDIIGDQHLSYCLWTDGVRISLVRIRSNRRNDSGSGKMKIYSRLAYLSVIFWCEESSSCALVSRCRSALGSLCFLICPCQYLQCMWLLGPFVGTCGCRGLGLCLSLLCADDPTPVDGADVEALLLFGVCGLVL